MNICPPTDTMVLNPYNRLVKLYNMEKSNYLIIKQLHYQEQLLPIQQHL